MTVTTTSTRGRRRGTSSSDPRAGAQEVLARMREYRWATSPAPNADFDAREFPVTGVVGEIKPHTPTGIESGLVQLRNRLRPAGPSGARPSLPARPVPQLVTYRQVRGSSPTFFELLAPRSSQLMAFLAGWNTKRPTGWRTALSTWFVVNRVEVPEAMTMVPLWQCASDFGSVMERYVRASYAARVRATLEQKTTWGHGADFRHELEYVAFLRELAHELEAEITGQA